MDIVLKVPLMFLCSPSCHDDIGVISIGCPLFKLIMMMIRILLSFPISHLPESIYFLVVKKERKQCFVQSAHGTKAFLKMELAGRGWGKEREMTETLYAHMNKRKKIKMKPAAL
jgi:hypothetical protein